MFIRHLILFSQLCCLLCLLSVTSRQLCAQTPIHLWTFDTDLSDSGSTGGANGTAIGDATISTAVNEFVLGSGGLRIEHDDADPDFVDITSPVFPTDAFTVNLFYRYDGTISSETPAENRNFLFETAPNFSVGVGLRAPDFDTEWFFAGGPNDTTGPGVDDAEWHQATLVWDKAGTNSVSFYHDGVLRDSVSLGAAVFDDAGQAEGLHIGNHRAGNGNRNWSGFIDEFAIYDTVLTPTQIDSLCDAALGNCGLVGADPFEAAINYNFPAGATSQLTRTGWGVATFADVEGPTNDLGDAGFLGGEFGQSALGTSTIRVELSNLPSHSDVSITGLLAQLDSLDPVRDGDIFRITLDGVEIFNENLGFGESLDGAFFEEPYSDPDGAAVVDGENLFGGGNFTERVYSLFGISALRSIPHTSSSLVLEIEANHNQPSSNESFGLDLLGIQLDVVVGDADGNGVVNEFDFFQISDNLGDSASAVGTDGDVNFDGLVTLSDFRLWKDNATPASLALLGFVDQVPEPASALLVVFGVVSVVAGRNFSRTQS